MSDIAIIQKATLYEMADAIIDTTERTEPFKVSDMPRLIREDVYNKGYADGEANGTSEPILYGTYLLRDNPRITTPSDTLILDLNDSEAYGFYLDGGDIHYGSITSVEFGDDGFIYVNIEDTYIEYDGTRWAYYDPLASEFVNPPDERYKIIDLKVPISVSKDIYDMFLGIVDNDQEKTSFDIGKKTQHDEFWNTFQDNGTRTDYMQAFSGWRDQYIRPLHKVIPTVARSLSTTFEKCPNLKKIEANYFDFSQVPFGTAQNQGAYYTFSACTSLEEIEDVGLPALFSYIYTFAWCPKLHTIAKVRFSESTMISNTFDNLFALVNLTIEGTIGQNGLNLQWSNKLSRASIISIINALSDTTSGLSITLSKTAVEKAFNIPSGIINPDWQYQLDKKPNWTINLV